MNPFRTRARQRRQAERTQDINERHAVAIAAWEDARGVVRYGLDARQWRRQRFMVQAQDAGLDHLKLVFVAWLIQQGRLTDDG